MKYDIFKMLTDRNPDGSVTYSDEDMDIIEDEYRFEQNFIRNRLGGAYDILLDEIKKRIAGLAEFAYNNEDEAVHFEARSGNFGENRYYISIHIHLWGEELEHHRVCRCGEQIGKWICSSETDSHNLFFTQDVDKEFIREVRTLFD